MSEIIELRQQNCHLKFNRTYCPIPECFEDQKTSENDNQVAKSQLLQLDNETDLNNSSKSSKKNNANNSEKTTNCISNSRLEAPPAASTASTSATTTTSTGPNKSEKSNNNTGMNFLLLKHTVYDKFNSGVPGQNGIWVKF